MATPATIDFQEAQPFYTFDLTLGDARQLIYIPKCLITIVNFGMLADGITAATDTIMVTPEGNAEILGTPYDWSAGVKIPIYARSSLIFNGNDAKKTLTSYRGIGLKLLSGVTMKCAIIRGAWSPLVR